MTYRGEFWVLDVAGLNINQPIESHLLVSVKNDIFRQPTTQFYLVEVSGALLLITWFINTKAAFANMKDYRKGTIGTFKFKIFELDVIKGELK